jgi:hypothetical protein
VQHDGLTGAVNSLGLFQFSRIRLVCELQDLHFLKEGFGQLSSHMDSS